jgi:hypothetical protein
MKLAPSLWLSCLPAELLFIALGRTPASCAHDSGAIRAADHAEELNCFPRLGLLDGKPDGRIDSRDRSPGA